MNLKQLIFFPFLTLQLGLAALPAHAEDKPTDPTAGISELAKKSVDALGSVDLGKLTKSDRTAFMEALGNLSKIEDRANIQYSYFSDPYYQYYCDGRGTIDSDQKSTNQRLAQESALNSCRIAGATDCVLVSTGPTTNESYREDHSEDAIVLKNWHCFHSATAIQSTATARGIMPKK
ncbi:hypothetical protein WDW37_00270 [Bdellovibrionota bacterium FG-1]